MRSILTAPYIINFKLIQLSQPEYLTHLTPVDSQNLALQSLNKLRLLFSGMQSHHGYFQCLLKAWLNGLNQMLNQHVAVYRILMHLTRTEFFALFLFVDTKNAEYRLLHFWIENTHRTTTYFIAVDHHIVSICYRTCWIGF